MLTISALTAMPTPVLQSVAEAALQILAGRESGSIVVRLARMRIGETALIVSKAQRFDGHFRTRAAERMGRPQAKWKTRRTTHGFRVTRVR